ncbi:MAG: metalloregulator ArsR/SmtB family transcription factor [Gammaproteobacteria bacterium]|nr:metalloregulator ArsR/SmtB family transcription factor [Gammaproteobacteria bacterium]
MNIETFKAISHPFRKQVIEQLANGESLGTQELKGDFGITKAAVSQHLKILRDAQLIHEIKVGRNKEYLINPDSIKEIFIWAQSFQAFWSSKMTSLNTYLEQEYGQD